MRLFLLSILIVVAIACILSFINYSPSHVSPMAKKIDIRYIVNESKISSSFSNKSTTPLLNKKNQQPIVQEEKDDSNTRYIYLTFDDGPDEGTPIVRNILKTEDIPGTFFIIGYHMINHTPALRKLFEDTLMHDPQFVCANHSFSHAYWNHYDKFYKDISGAVADFIRNQDSCHFTNKIIRAPGSNVWRIKDLLKKYRGGYANRNLILDSLAELGFIVIGWDLEWEFTKNERLKESTSQMLYYVDRFFKEDLLSIPNHLVLLMHDRTLYHTEDANKLKHFIEELKKDKKYTYKFKTLLDYPLIKKVSQ